jgi:hypothetical protein
MIDGFEQNPAYIGKTLGTDQLKARLKSTESRIGANPDTVAELITTVIRGEKSD